MMFNPCYEHCYLRYGSQYTKDCNSRCEFALAVIALKEFLIKHEGCNYCKHYKVCVSGSCNNHEKFVLDFDRLKTEFSDK